MTEKELDEKAQIKDTYIRLADVVRLLNECETGAVAGGIPAAKAKLEEAMEQLACTFRYLDHEEEADVVRVPAGKYWLVDPVDYLTVTDFEGLAQRLCILRADQRARDIGLLKNTVLAHPKLYGHGWMLQRYLMVALPWKHRTGSFKAANHADIECILPCTSGCLILVTAEGDRPGCAVEVDITEEDNEVYVSSNPLALNELVIHGTGADMLQLGKAQLVETTWQVQDDEAWEKLAAINVGAVCN